MSWSFALKNHFNASKGVAKLRGQWSNLLEIMIVQTLLSPLLDGLYNLA